MDLMMTKTRYSREGCKITTVIRRHPSFGLTEEIILEAEDLYAGELPELVQEDDGKWLIGGM